MVCTPLDQIKKAYMENRLEEIKEENITSFRYVASDQNPADLATRGSSGTEFTLSFLWWHGSSWFQFVGHSMILNRLLLKC